MKKKIHYIGLAHTIPNHKYAGCAFTNLSINFCKMMKKLNYEIIFYGVEGNYDIQCDEYVNIFSEEEFHKFYPNNLNIKNQFDYGGEAFSLFAERCGKEIVKRVPDGKKEIALSSWMYEAFEHTQDKVISVDPHVGHMGRGVTYRVFPSRTWRSSWYINYSDIQTFYDDTVIYHYVDPDYFYYDKSIKKEDYMLFIGRMNIDKGVYLAMDVAEHLKIPLIISGLLPGGELEELFFNTLKTKKYSEFVGYCDLNKKLDLMKRARCLFTYPMYLEPFGIVAIEAQSVGTPVVTCNWGALSETVLHGRTGYQCSYFDDLLDAVEKSKNINPLDCVNWINSNFTTNVASLRYDEYLQRLLLKENMVDKNFWYEKGFSEFNKQLNIYY